MPMFKDSTGREWLVTITVGTLKRSKAEGVALPRAIGPGFSEFIADPAQVASALWVICEPHKHGVTEDDFANRLDGPAFQAASVAVTEAIVDFSQSPATATAMKEHLGRRMNATTAAMTEAMRAMPTTKATTQPTTPTPSSGGATKSEASSA